MNPTLRDLLAPLGLQLPPNRPAATASYEPFLLSANLLLFSGVVSLDDDRVATGRVGIDVDTQQGRHAARLSALGLLARLDAALEGDLRRLVRISRLTVYVAAAPDFTEHSKVGDGASELFIQVLGDRGRHTRSAIGVASLPRGATVEIDAIVEVRP